MGKSIPYSSVLGILLRMTLYDQYFAGVNVVMFVMAAYFCVKKYSTSRQSMNKIVTIVGLTLLLLDTVQCGILVNIVLYPFSSGDSSQVDELLTNYISTPANIAELALFSVEVELSDMLMIYRLWIIWGRNKLIVTPPVCVLVACIVAQGAWLREVQIIPADINFFESPAAKWMAGGLGGTCGISLYCTVLMSYKIWRYHSIIKEITIYSKASSVSRVMATVIESAAIYSGCMLLLLVSLVCRSLSGAYIGLNMGAPLTGITYSLVIIRAGMGGRDTFTTVEVPMSVFSAPRRSETFATRQMEVHVECIKTTLDTLSNDVDIEAKASSSFAT